MPDITLAGFQNALSDVCRPNRFYVSIDPPIDLEDFQEDDFILVKGASLPGRSIGEHEQWWQGERYKILCDSTYDDVTITFWNNYDDSGANLRDKFEDWMNLIASDEDNIRGNHSDVKGEVNISQLGRDGTLLKTYTLKHSQPKAVGDIELSMDNTDQVEEFTVIFSYSYFTTDSSDGSQGEMSGEDVESSPTIDQAYTDSMNKTMNG
jgi:hypothetical protein